MQINGFRPGNSIPSSRPMAARGGDGRKQPDGTVGLDKASTPATLQDTVTISAQERERLQEALAKKQQQEAEAQGKALKEQMESANAQAEAMSDSTKMQMKCMLIASRIMAGDEVPKEDYRYLAKNNSELYGKAVSLRITRENPKKYKRISEEEQTGESTPAAATENPDVAEPPAVEGGSAAAEDAPPATETGEAS